MTLLNIDTSFCVVYDRNYCIASNFFSKRKLQRIFDGINGELSVQVIVVSDVKSTSHP